MGYKITKHYHTSIHSKNYLHFYKTPATSTSPPINLLDPEVTIASYSPSVSFPPAAAPPASPTYESLLAEQESRLTRVNPHPIFPPPEPQEWIVLFSIVTKCSFHIFSVRFLLPFFYIFTLILGLRRHNSYECYIK